MAEKMVFNEPGSLRQLVGWMIDDVEMRPDASLILTISQLTAENKQHLCIKPHVTVGLMGNLTVHNPALEVSAEPFVSHVKDGP